LDDLLRSIRLNVLESKIRPYSNVKLDYLAKSINITVPEVKQLLSALILEERIDGWIDATTGILEINDNSHQ
jgi:COP9 signalosome complex subunit 2